MKHSHTSENHSSTGFNEDNFFVVVQTKMIRACKPGSDALFRKTVDQATAKLALKPKSNDSLSGLTFPIPFVYLKGIHEYTPHARYGSHLSGNLHSGGEDKH